MTRRSFLGRAGVTTLLASLPGPVVAQSKARANAAAATNPECLEILRYPDRVTAYSDLSNEIQLVRVQSHWSGAGIDVETKVGSREVIVSVQSPRVPVSYIHLRWNLPVVGNLKVLGDHWERSYGDLGWRNIIPERVMPWYFATYDDRTCHGYGVKTGAAALCFWQLDRDGVSFWLNLSNGGSGVMLGQRNLVAATVVTQKGNPDTDPIDVLREFCHRMCSRPSRSYQPIYGANDWDYAYGKNTAKRILEDTDFVAKLSASNAVRAFSVVDMGWSQGTPAFPSMAELALQIQQRGVRPGIWIRCLEAPSTTRQSYLLSDARFGEQENRAKEVAYDPTVPEALELVLAQVKQVVDWGYELVKHDFSTYDLLGRWGFEMGAEPTLPGWSLHDRSRTNAEIIQDLYQRIRTICGQNVVILGCNTIGHLAQGHFDIQRTGDDTSGRIWERTRRMGVNTLAFRCVQHRTFFTQDADIVGITEAIPWEANRQWLDLIAHSGTALFVSAGDGARVPEHAQQIQRAFRLVSKGGDGARPLTCIEESTPQKWAVDGSGPKSRRELHYDWCMGQGAFPFTV